MTSLTISLETVTPLFLSGAEPRGAPELRVPSVRGALRYWLRAALGGVLGDRDLDALRKAESAVFGSTEGASGVLVSLAHPDVAMIPFEKQRPIHDSGPRPKPTGRDYLYWSMAGFREQAPKQAIPERTTFSLTLAARPGVSNSAGTLYQSLTALWLLVHLGSLGSRSRRTAGSLRATKSVSMDKLPSFESPGAVKELTGLLGQGLTTIRQELTRMHKAQAVSHTSPTRFDILHPNVCKIWVLTGSSPWKTSAQAVEEIGARLRDFRSYRKPDHDTVREWLDRGKRPPTVERAAFGLPLPFRYSDGGPADVLQGHDHDRRTSPLSLRVSQLASGQFLGVAVLFESELLPHGESLQFQRSRKETAPPQNYDLLHKFIRESFTALEVEYQ